MKASETRFYMSKKTCALMHFESSKKCIPARTPDMESIYTPRPSRSASSGAMSLSDVNDRDERGYTVEVNENAMFKSDVNDRDERDYTVEVNENAMLKVISIGGVVEANAPGFVAPSDPIHAAAALVGTIQRWEGPSTAMFFKSSAGKRGAAVGLLYFYISCVILLNFHSKYEYSVMENEHRAIEE
ncbi:hypothetical protein K438DRAFT_1764878 [Mycena galopus ATCC 62051]|nr:hypothetical protein K438DRAFT_1764878 [Mycena galopus ATCC 62051]